MENFVKITHQRIAQFINKASAVVVNSYELYLASGMPEDKKKDSKKDNGDSGEQKDMTKPETFKEFHDAGKSAASHLESLLKLADKVDNPDERKQREEKQEKEQETSRKLRLAQKEIDMNKGRDE